MFAVTSHSRPQLSFADMRAFLEHGWGELGNRVAGCWRDFNDRYFDGRLKPLPIVLVATSPHGHWLCLTHGSRNGHGTHWIELTHPGHVAARSEVFQCHGGTRKIWTRPAL